MTQFEMLQEEWHCVSTGWVARVTKVGIFFQEKVAILDVEGKLAIPKHSLGNRSDWALDVSGQGGLAYTWHERQK